jgi:hypothetical protein
MSTADRVDALAAFDDWQGAGVAEREALLAKLPPAQRERLLARSRPIVPPRRKASSPSRRSCLIA